jgi:hypothetical protein
MALILCFQPSRLLAGGLVGITTDLLPELLVMAVLVAVGFSMGLPQAQMRGLEIRLRLALHRETTVGQQTVTTPLPEAVEGAVELLLLAAQHLHRVLAWAALEPLLRSAVLQ